MKHIPPWLHGGVLWPASILFVVFAIGAGGVGSAPAGDWLTGEALRRQAESTVDVVYSDTLLRQALLNLARAKRVAILMDRRVDPGQKITLALEDLPLEQAFRAIAHGQGIEARLLGPVYYFGPPRTVSRLRTVATLRRADTRRLPEPARERLFREQPLQWDDFSTPRELLERWSRKSGLDIQAEERIPHDLWAAADLPPMSLIDQLTLLVAQFDLTFTFSDDGTQLRLVPIPDDVALTRRYPGGMDPERLAEKWARLVPEARVFVDEKQIVVRGLLEDHECLTTGEPPSRRKPVSRDQDDTFERQRFTLTVARQPLGKVLQQLAVRLKLNLKIDRASIQQAGISLEKRVSFQVREAPVDELLRAVLEPSGLVFRRTGTSVEVHAAN